MDFFRTNNLEKCHWAMYLVTLVFAGVGVTVGQLIAFVIGAFFGVNPIEIFTSTQNNVVFFVQIFPFLVGLTTMLLSVHFFHKRSFWTVITARDKFDWSRCFFAIVIWLVVLLAEYVTFYFVGGQYVLNWQPDKFFPLLILALFFVPFQAAFEDILFRGVLLQAFGRFLGSALVGIIGTGILFGLLHFANPEMNILGWKAIFLYIQMGVFFGIIAVMDDGLELNIGIHFINNFFLFTIITTDWQVMTTDAIIKDITPPSFSIWSLIPLAVIQLIVLFIFSKKYNWENWRTKILGNPVS